MTVAPLHSWSVRCLLALCLCATLPALAAKPSGEPGSLRSTPPDMTYFARQGDTLSSVAQRFTGKSQNWPLLGKRNKIADDRAIPVGSAILIPLELLPEEASEARVIALSGNGTVKLKPADGAELPLTLGLVLQEGARITTGKNGFLTLALPDDSRISIPSNSQVSLSKLRKTKYTASPRTEIALLQGKIESRVTPLAANKGRFEVRSPLTVAGVRGTHFRIGVNPDGIVNEVLSGGVAVGQLQKPDALLLAAGTGNLIGRSGVGPAQRLLPPPQLNDGYRLQQRPTMQFGVTPSAAARAYRVQVATDALTQNVLAENYYPAQSERFKFDGVADGKYFVRITAIDQTGLEGMPQVQAFTLKARPEPPFTAQPKNKLRADKVEFAWTEAADASAYHLQLARDAAFTQMVLERTDLTGAQFGSGPLPYGVYFWRVATIAQKDGGSDHGPFGDIQNFTLLPPQTMAPVSDSGGDLLEFSWAAEPGQKFLLQIGRDAAFRNLYLSRELEQAEFKIARPEPGQYFIRVRATDADGYTGAFSATQKLNIFPRWTSGDGSALGGSGGVVRAGF